MKARQLQIIVWTIFTSVVVLALVAWGQGNGWKLTHLGFYQIFPLFGLLAFSMMWSHYMAVVLRLYFKIEPKALKTYFESTSMAVLAAILLHPGLLGWQAWRDGLGLPPGSQISYVAPKLGLYVVLGMIAYFAFLSFELRRKYGSKPWFKYISYASDTAMLLIIIHSLRLGSQLQAGWFRTVWYFYGLTLLSALAYIYARRFQQSRRLVHSK